MSTRYWTNHSVLHFAGNSDPVELVRQKARELVLKAIQAGWQGPPFDPFKLAEFLDIPTLPREDLQDARIVPYGAKRVQIEFNPNRSRGRVRFSIAHEIAHTLFPDYIDKVRNRGVVSTTRNDDWQLELLCNLATAELLMPVGYEMDSTTPVTIDNVLRLQKEFDVSTEAISIRLAKITLQPCTIIAAARISDSESNLTYRLDYNIPSRTSRIDLLHGIEVNSTLMSQCTAIGFTAKGSQQRIGKFNKLNLECVGIPPYPGRKYPRVIGIAHHENGEKLNVPGIMSVRGDALEPRGTGPRIIAHIVNDKTPNWGAGFARAIRNKYPEVQKEFRNWAKDNSEQFALGNTHVSVALDNLYIVNMIAQHGYGKSIKPRIRYAELRNCLSQLENIAKERGASVHMPRIGTGYAGGNWSYISELVDDILVRKGIAVTIYTLPSYEPIETQSALKLALTEIN